MEYLGPWDFSAPALFSDIVISPLHGEDQAVCFLIDPPFSLIEQPDQRVFSGKAPGIFHNALRPQVTDLADAFYAKVFCSLIPATRVRGWTEEA